MKRRALMFSTGIVLCCSCVLHAEQILVPANYHTVQEAIDAAADGDEVLVSPGIYYEAINFYGKAITVRSMSGADQTAIDASDLSASVVRCVNGEGPGTILDGFTITGGTGTFENNRRKGGGMFNYQSSPTVRNCVFTYNSISAYEFTIEGGGAGMYNEFASPTIENCVFSYNYLFGCSGWLNGGAGMYNDGAAPKIVDCRFENNDGNNGGGMMNISGANPEVVNCTFIGNNATFSGGGLNNTNDADAMIVNCLFFENTAYHGAALYATSASIEIVNCTVTANHATNKAGGFFGIANAANNTSISNSIFWDNIANNEPQNAEIAAISGASPSILYSNVKGGWSGPGADNMNVNPLFTDDGAIDFALDQSSPCVNAGMNSAIPQIVTTDTAGNPRIADSVVDLGRYEVQSEIETCASDLTGDQTVDTEDFLIILAEWGSCPGSCAACDSDINDDCVTDLHDLLALLQAWGDCD